MFVYVPEKFDPSLFLPAHLHPFADCTRVLVHLVETARVFNKLHTEAFVPRKAAYLRRLVHKERYLAIRDALLSSGVLEMDRHFLVGQKSRGFKIGERFKDALFRRYKLSDRAAIRRVEKVRAEQCPALTDATHRGLQTWLSRLEVDYEAAWASLRGMALPPDTLRQRHLALSMLHDREFFFKPDRHGRVHTNLTNLWSGFRQFLRCDGECLVNIDIGNSQPLFFGLLVLVLNCNKNSLPSPSSPSPFHYDAGFSGTRELGYAKKKDIPEDVRRYLRITEQAQFYEHMMKALGIPIIKERRDAFKKEFFGRVFYSKPNYYTKERKAFQAEFLNAGSARNPLRSWSRWPVS